MKIESLTTGFESINSKISGTTEYENKAFLTEDDYLQLRMLTITKGTRFIRAAGESLGVDNVMATQYKQAFVNSYARSGKYLTDGFLQDSAICLVLFTG